MKGLLTTKLGPLPRWAWAAIIIGGYYAYRRYKGSTSSAVTQGAPSIVTGSAGPDLSGQGQPGTAGVTSTGDTTQATSDILSTLGQQNANLISGLLAGEQNVVALAQAQQGNLLSNTATAPIDTTTPGTLPQPGTGNAPTIVYNITPPTSTQSKPKAAPAKTPAKAPTPARYYTYKNQVKLGAGQSLHFTSGKGYYAA